MLAKRPALFRPVRWQWVTRLIWVFSIKEVISTHGTRAASAPKINTRLPVNGLPMINCVMSRYHAIPWLFVAENVCHFCTQLSKGVHSRRACSGSLGLRYSIMAYSTFFKLAIVSVHALASLAQKISYLALKLEHRRPK